MPIPDHVKAQADAVVADATVEKMPFQDMGAREAVDNYGDRGIALDAMREEKRQDALNEKISDLQATSEVARGGNSFEQALAEKLQEAIPASLDNSHEIDR